MPEQVSVQDGRVARRLGNRVRIVDALFALIRAGKPHPTLKEVAAAAGVTPRTLLNHFPDVASLLAAAAARGRELAEVQLPAVSMRSSGTDPEQRVHEFFRRAAGFYDGYAAIRWSTLTAPGPLPGYDLRQHKSVVLGRIEARVAELFAGFDVTLERDRELRQAVLVMIDPLAWRLLRVQQGLTRADAARAMARGVIALARGARARR